ncbi:MAG: hypothetical protein LBG77_07850 [Dysgonamonadaceae bacterium]|nr:hypothetical protein [Dysgonamonadaceae bacterium]
MKTTYNYPVMRRKFQRVHFRRQVINFLAIQVGEIYRLFSKDPVRKMTRELRLLPGML